MTVRVNITISDDMKRYFENWSKESGIAQSSLMSLAMSEYISQRQALESLAPILKHIDKMGGIDEFMKTE